MQEALELVTDVARDRRLVLLEASIVLLIVFEIVLSLIDRVKYFEAGAGGFVFGGTPTPAGRVLSLQDPPVRAPPVPPASARFNANIREYRDCPV